MLSIRVQNNLLEFYKSQKLYGNISSEIKQEGSYFNPKLAAVKARKRLLSVGRLSSFSGICRTLRLQNSMESQDMGVQICRVAVMPESKILLLCKIKLTLHGLKKLLILELCLPSNGAANEKLFNKAKIHDSFKIQHHFHIIPHGLMARILGFHPRGPGSIPGVGEHFFVFCLECSYFLIFRCVNISRS